MELFIINSEILICKLEFYQIYYKILRFNKIMGRAKAKINYEFDDMKLHGISS